MRILDRPARGPVAHCSEIFASAEGRVADPFTRPKRTPLNFRGAHSSVFELCVLRRGVAAITLSNFSLAHSFDVAEGLALR
jgi:hypothetical protein